jgi:hypothetical protein
MARIKPESVTQFTQGSLNHADIGSRFDIGEQFEGILNDVRHKAAIVPAALILNQFMNLPLELPVHWGPFPFSHVVALFSLK